jgi:hypothetical protein
MYHNFELILDYSLKEAEDNIDYIKPILFLSNILNVSKNEKIKDKTLKQFDKYLKYLKKDTFYIKRISDLLNI